jgi:NAD(P)-dependent dehydrogenase (short-subunit alcohol dehydrogenase family)
MNRLQGKSVLLTGGANGIGRVASQLFCDEGASVVIADIARERGELLEHEIRERGGRCVFVECDVTEEDEVRRAVDTALQRFGGLHVLYNNAGASTLADGPVTLAPADEFWRAIRLNLFGTWLCCRHAIPELVKAGGGAVVNTTSTVALMGLRNVDAYTASKGGVAALTRSMAAEFAPQKVRVNAIAPTSTRTERVLALRKQRTVGNETGRNLLGDAEPIDVAMAALYLACDESARTTGHILPVDSGLTMS